MTANFDYFIVFAEMRTGSNFLESNLNAFDGLQCHGEAFNPHFIGYPNKTDVLGISQSVRDADPAKLIDAVRAQSGVLGGFRYFHDHDPRILDNALGDAKCAKIILTRNPLDSYVSWKIAQATGQWKLTDVKRRKDAKARFDTDEFLRHVNDLQAFQVSLLNRLQSAGQAPFYLAYEDLQNLDVMNGLAAWLGVSGRLEDLNQSLKRQNPSPVASKVSNPDEMVAALGRIDQFNLTRTPNFEPRRGAAVPSYVGATETPLIFLPIRGGPEDEIAEWLAALDQATLADLTTGMNQKQLRQWKRRNPGHRSFTILRHPVARAHAVFCKRILGTGPGSYLQIRQTLRKQFNLPVPESYPCGSFSRSAHRDAFLAFLEFVRLNLAGQTALRVDAEWATQWQCLNGFGDFQLPDHVFRETEVSETLPQLARHVGHQSPPPIVLANDDSGQSLNDIYDGALEALVAKVYQRDYLMFGFGPWCPDGPDGQAA